MFGKFKDGAAFGAGFAVTYMLIYYGISVAFTSFFAVSSPSLEPAQVSPGQDHALISPEVSNSTEIDKVEPGDLKFHELPINQKIEKASVVAVIRYREPDDDVRKAYISDFIKRTTDSNFEFEIGDDYKYMNQKANTGFVENQGMVMFFTDSPRHMKYATALNGNIVFVAETRTLDELKAMASVD